MTTYSFFRFYAWQTDASGGKTTSITVNPITHFTNVSRTLNLSAPGEMTLTCFLSDADASVLGKTHYFELYAGKNQNPSNDLSGGNGPAWETGYIQSIDRDPTQGGLYNITGATPMIKLATFLNLEDQQMKFTTDNPANPNFGKGYRNVMYALNGLDGSGGMGGPGTSQPPGTKGILTGSGWRAEWVRADSNGINIGQSDPINKIAGHGDSWLTAWENSLKNVQLLATHYNCFFRELPGATSGKGVIQFGPLGDNPPSGNNPSGGKFTIWGGKPLEQKLSLDGNTDANASAAQLEGDALIQAATYDDNMADVVNLVFPIGKRGGGNYVNISNYFPPIKDKKGKINSASAGGAHDYYDKYQPVPGGRVYWKVKDSVTVGNTTYTGIVDGTTQWKSSTTLARFRLLAAQNNDTTFAYGVANEYSIGIYGIHESRIIDHYITEPYLLLSAAIGAVGYNAEPVPAWTFIVKHPLTSDTGVPRSVLPGNIIDVQYEGLIHKSINMAADGTITTGAAVSYLKFPVSTDVVTRNTDGTIPSGSLPVNGIYIDSAMFIMMRRVTKIQEVWTSQGFNATYTLGKGRFKGKHWADNIANKFEHHVGRPTGTNTHRALKHGSLDHINFLFLNGAQIINDTGPGFFHIPVGVSSSTDPGGVVVSDVKGDEIFFDDHHHVTFSFKLDDDHQVLDFWFHKPITSTLGDYDVHDHDTYGIVRFAGKASGQHGGILIKNPKQVPGGGSASPVAVGHRVAKSLHIPNGLQRDVNYTATIEWSGDTYHVHIKYPEEEKSKNRKVFFNRLYCTWHDKNKYIDQTGAIGWHGIGTVGKPIQVWGLAAHPIHRKHAATHHENGGGGGGGRPARTETLVPGQTKATDGAVKAHGGHGFRVYEWDDAQDGLNTKSYLAHAVNPAASHTRGDTVTTAHPNEVLLQSGITSGSNYISFDSPTGKVNPSYPHNGLPPNTLRSNYSLTIHDNYNDGTANPPIQTETVTIKSLTVGKHGWIHGATINEKFLYSHTVNTTNPVLVTWDHLEESDNNGHKIFTFYHDTGHKESTGFYKALLSADFDTVKRNKKTTFAIGPDGRFRMGQFITDAEGNVLPIAKLAADADHFALGLEHHGVILFDAGEYNSKTQKAYTYTDAGARTLLYDATDSNVSNPMHQTFYTGDPSTTQGSWMSSTVDATSGVGDAILQLTTGATQTTVVWQDTQILEEPDPKHTSATGGYVAVKDQGTGNVIGYAKQRKYKVHKDVGIHLPIYIEPSKFSANAISLGAKTKLDLYASAGDTTLSVYDRPSHFNLHTAAPYDTWVINASGTNSETVTVTGFSDEDHTITLSAPLVNAHTPNEELHMTTYGGTKVYSSGTLEAKTALDDKLAQVDVIAVGFLDSNGNWYRGWWGDPAWKSPYKNDTTLGTTKVFKYIGGFGGNLGLSVGDWSDLHVKTSELGMYAKGAPTITIVGVELAIHSQSAVAPMTVFFDAHEHGHASGPKKNPTGGTGPAHVAPGAVKGHHKHPPHHNDAHLHSDLFMWAEKQKAGTNSGKYRVHWEHDTGPGTGPATLILHNTKKTTVFAGPPYDGTAGGASEEHPNIGIPAMPIIDSTGTVATLAAGVGSGTNDQTDINNIKGNYVVFNSNPSGYFVHDPGVVGGKVWIPGHVQGTTTAQTVGFAVVTELFNWQNKKSGSAILQGPHEDLFKVGKIANIVDRHTGELHIMGHGPHTKRLGKHHRKGSVGRSHHHHNTPGKQAHHGLVYSLDSTGKSPNTATQCTFHANLGPGVTSGQIVSNSGIVIGTISSNQYLNGVNPADYIVYDDGTSSGNAVGFYHYAPTGTGQLYDVKGNFNLNHDAAIGIHEIGKVSAAPDSHTKQYYLVGHHHGSHQHHGTHHAPKSHGRRHDHPHKPGKHVHHNIVYHFVNTN